MVRWLRLRRWVAKAASAWGEVIEMRPARYLTVSFVVVSMLAALMLMAPVASAAPTGVASCQTLGVPGAYALAADVAAVDATCMVITASNVKLDLAGHTISCTGGGFAGSCQVPEFRSHGVQVAPGLTGVVVTGPGTITGFDNGVVIEDSNALVKGITITGPACTRPTARGLPATGSSCSASRA